VSELAIPAEEVSEQQRKKKRKREIDEEGFEVGRYLGVIARRNPELYERLKQYAEASGNKFTDIVYEALELYDEYLQLSAVDTRALIAALRLLDHLFKRLLQMMMTLNQYFTSEFFQQQIEIMHSIRQQQVQQQQVMIQQEKKGKYEEIKTQLMSMTMQMLMKLLSGLVTNMMNIQSMMKGGQSLPQTQVQAPPLPISNEGVKIVRSARKREATKATSGSS